MRLLFLAVNGKAYANGIHAGSRRPDPRARDIDLVSAFKPHPQVRGDRNEIPYVPASSWIGMLRHLLEKYYGLPAQTPRIRRKGEETIIAPIHECGVLDEILKCPVCKLLARRDVVALFNDMDPLGSEYKVQKGTRAGEYLVYNEDNQLVVQVFVKDEVIIPRDIERVTLEPGQIGLKSEKSIKGEDLIKQGYRLEPIPRQVQAVSGIFKFGAKFDMVKLTLDDIKPFFIGLALIEEWYIGRRGSRGYGRIEFKDLEIELLTAKYYEGGESMKLQVGYNKPREILANWNKVKQVYEETVKKLRES